MKIELLKNYPEFIDELNELFYDEWHHFHADRKKPQWKERLLTRVNGETIPTVLIALDNNTLLGSASLVVSDMDTRSDLSPWLAAVYVKDECRGQGVGRKLVLAIENLAAKLNIETLYLYTPSKELFYKYQGWETIEKTEYKNSDVVIMKKEIK